MNSTQQSPPEETPIAAVDGESAEAWLEAHEINTLCSLGLKELAGCKLDTENRRMLLPDFSRSGSRRMLNLSSVSRNLSDAFSTTDLNESVCISPTITVSSEARASEQMMEELRLEVEELRLEITNKDNEIGASLLDFLC